MSPSLLPFYDSHMHSASLAKKAPELLPELKSALANGTIQQCIDIGLNPGDQAERLPLLADLGIAWYTLGLYPSHAGDNTLASILERLAADISQAIPAMAPAPKLVAIGEIGIDLFHDYASLSAQKDLFIAQLELANQFNLPVVIHNREANREIIECIDRCPPKAGGILHCFSADWASAAHLLDMDFSISFAGNLTYKTAENLRDIAQKLPADCLLCETDSPYLSPVPLRGKPNTPINVRLVYECLAEIRQVPLAELCLQIQANLSKRLRLTWPPVARA